MAEIEDQPQTNGSNPVGVGPVFRVLSEDLIRLYWISCRSCLTSLRNSAEPFMPLLPGLAGSERCSSGPGQTTPSIRGVSRASRQISRRPLPRDPVDVPSRHLATAESKQVPKNNTKNGSDPRPRLRASADHRSAEIPQARLPTGRDRGGEVLRRQSATACQSENRPL